jgi:hypothetical protein
MKDEQLYNLIVELLNNPKYVLHRRSKHLYFNLTHLESLAGKHCVIDDRGKEYGHENQNKDNFPTFNFPEFEEYIWKKIKNKMEQNNVTFVNSFLVIQGLSMSVVDLHLHREALRQENNRPYNYTFFFTTDDSQTANFEAIDYPISFDEILKYRLLDYKADDTDYIDPNTVENLKLFTKDFPVKNYVLSNNTGMRFNACKIAHKGISHFVDNTIYNCYLVLTGCSDTLPDSLHEHFTF